MIGCSRWSKACSMFSKPMVMLGTAAASVAGYGGYRYHQRAKAIRTFKDAWNQQNREHPRVYTASLPGEKTFAWSPPML